MAKVSFFLVVFFFLYLLSQKQRQSVTASGDPNATPLLAFSFPSSSDNISVIGLKQGGGSNSNINSNVSISINSGLVLYRHPIHSINGFSTSFSFSPPHANANANAFTFFLTLATVSLDLLHGPPPSILSLSFIADSIHNRLRIRVAGFVNAPLAHQDHYFLLNNNNNNNSSKLHAWIDYNYDYDAALMNMNHRLEMRLTRSNTTNTAPAPAKPHSPILSYPLDLSNVLSRETMLVGFASTDNCTLYQWMFVAHHGAPYLMHSQPLDPNKFPAQPAPNPSPPRHLIKSHPWGLVLALIFAAACGAMLTFFAVFVWFSVCAHRPVAPVEYPVHPVDVAYEKIVLVGLKDSVHNK